MTSSGETSSAPIQIFTTKMEWKVKRSAFNTPEGSKQSIQSDVFRANPSHSVYWALILYPRNHNDENRDYVGLYFGPSNISDPTRVRFKTGFIASDGTEKNVFSATKLYTRERNWVFGQHQFIRRDQVLDPAENFFRDDQLTIFCDLEVYKNPEVQVPKCTFKDDWSKLLESGDFSDAVLVVGDEEIKAHKLVLSTRSPVFAAMFKYNTTENQTGRVLIEDLDVVGVKAFLSYIYSGEVKDLKAIAEKVLPAADKYGVDRLKIMCEKEICEKLTVENVVDMSSLAERHAVTQLKTHALSFISLNATEVLEQDSFWDLANTDLVRETVRFSNMRTEKNSDGLQVKRRKLN